MKIHCECVREEHQSCDAMILESKELSVSILTRSTCSYFAGKSAAGPKRALPALAATVLKNPKIQEAVVDKGLEVMNKLVDKQFRIIDEAQEKASNFLAKEVGKVKVADSEGIQMGLNR